MKPHKLPDRCIALLLALVLLLSLAACDQNQNRGTAATTMYLARAEGSVTVSDSAGNGVKLLERLGLYSGYGVNTRSRSYAWINLDEVKLTKMDEESEVAIQKEGRALEIEVKSGSLFFNVTEPLDEGETMDIRTSTMLVGIRGTCGWVEVSGSGDILTLYLLEGTVECAAGDNTAAVTAGEKAVMTADGRIYVTQFLAGDIPGFVAEEILNDGDLAEAIRKACGIQVVQRPPATYEELLDTMDDVVYSELIDFEADGSPELLVIYLSDSRHIDGIRIYRDGGDGPRSLYSAGFYTHGAETYSLVESDGRLYVHRYSAAASDAGGYYDCFDAYVGSVAQSDGVWGDWGHVDFTQIDFDENGTPYRTFVSTPAGDGLVHVRNNTNYDQASANSVDGQGGYAFVRGLLSYDGESVTVTE